MAEYVVRQLSHTADLGFEVESPVPEGLFEGAAEGLARLLRAEEDQAPSGGRGGEVRGLGAESVEGSSPEGAAGPRAPGDGSGAEAEERWTLESGDRERLLVAWLRELLHRALQEGRLPRETEVALVGPASLRADVRWDPDAGRDDVHREIKGVTYHGLRIVHEYGRWRARLVFDV